MAVGCARSGQRASGLEQIAQSGITTSGDVRIKVTPIVGGAPPSPGNAAPSPPATPGPAAPGVVRLAITDVTINATQPPVYYDEWLYKLIFQEKDEPPPAFQTASEAGTVAGAAANSVNDLQARAAQDVKAAVAAADRASDAAAAAEKAKRAGNDRAEAAATARATAAAEEALAAARRARVTAARTEIDGALNSEWKTLLEGASTPRGLKGDFLANLTGGLDRLKREWEQLWVKGLREGMRQARITYGAEVAVLLTAYAIHDNGDKSKLIADQPLFRVENLLLRRPNDEGGPASFRWKRQQKVENRLLESERRVTDYAVDIPLTGAPLYELELTIAQKSNIAEGLRLGAEKLMEFVEKQGGTSLGMEGLVGKAIKVILGYLADRLEDAVHLHEQRYPVSLFLRTPVPAGGTFTLEAAIRIHEQPGDFAYLNFNDPFRKLLLRYPESDSRYHRNAAREAVGKLTGPTDTYLTVIRFEAALSASERLLNPS
ncbi:MAG: hypothetical protein HY763_02070 [Planctomycetes bacterium]|nr:hypothetical protein [Planctomycetota bacterium]